ncbi:MAG TPA: ABC transporter ATP-binding protein [Pusillimonas sp.]|nr:ABC transporter ATP-binding protein [Pusillimonas sp.]
MLLEIEKLSAGHGDAIALHDVSLRVPEGQSVAVLGRNGAGKTTLLETIMGLTTRYSGDIRFQGEVVSRRSPVQRAHKGLGWVPQEREVFPSLTVAENLKVVHRDKGPWDLDKVFGLFPRLEERQANLGSQLSGGEQQMLALSRALMSRPRLLLLDEPSLGLAPLIVREIFKVIISLRDHQMSVLVVEQNARIALESSDYCYVMEGGRFALHGAAKDLAKDARVVATYLGVSRASQEVSA